VHQRVGIPLEVLERAALMKRFPQIALDGVELGLFEHDRGRADGAARRADAGAGVRRCGRRVSPGCDPAAESRCVVRFDPTTDGESLSASRFVFACGPWLPKVFPKYSAQRIFPTRQEVFFFAPPAGDTRFAPRTCPAGRTSTTATSSTGCRISSRRGFKIAHDQHGRRSIPTSAIARRLRRSSPRCASIMQRAFPRWRTGRWSKRACASTRTARTAIFLIDRHPQWENVVLVGGGSGHGFKHGPAVGNYAAQLVNGTNKNIEPRFSLQSKTAQQRRDVH
jgi:glycine/D-amino acid oxidase-like deaminating enzyme